MVITRQIFGLCFEEYWFDGPGFSASPADIAALRCQKQCPGNNTLIKERTLQVDLRSSQEALFTAVHGPVRTSVRWMEKNGTVVFACSPDDRTAFYRAYVPFAQQRKLLVPNPDEERELDIFLARSLDGQLLHAAAFFPVPSESIYIYRYGVAVQKSQAGAALLWAAMVHAKQYGFSFFDLGGIPKSDHAPLKYRSIYHYKAQYGGVPVDQYVYFKARNAFVRTMVRCLVFIMERETMYVLISPILAFLSKIRKGKDLAER